MKKLFVSLAIALATTTATAVPRIVEPIMVDMCRYNAEEHESALVDRAKGNIDKHWTVDMHPFIAKWGEANAVPLEQFLKQKAQYLFANPNVFKNDNPAVVRTVIFEGCMKDAMGLKG